MLHHLHNADLRRRHVNEGSVFYRCAKAGLYRQLKQSVPPGVQPRPDYETSFRQWTQNGYPPLK